MAGKFGGSFNLAIWRIWSLIARLKTAKLKFAGGRQCQCCSSHAWDAKLKSANYVQMAHSIILAKFSCYVYTVSRTHARTHTHTHTHTRTRHNAHTHSQHDLGQASSIISERLSLIKDHTNTYSESKSSQQNWYHYYYHLYAVTFWLVMRCVLYHCNWTPDNLVPSPEVHMLNGCNFLLQWFAQHVVQSNRSNTIMLYLQNIG